MSANLVAKCILEPRGSGGLEGYQCGDRYMAELVKPVKGEGARPSYYRIWPVIGQNYETCSVRVFNRFFKEII